MALYRKSLTLAASKQVLLQSARTSAMGLMIIVGANVFGPFLALTHIPGELSGLLVGLELGKYGTLAVIVAVYIVLGCFLEGFAMLVLTLPIVLPIIKSLGWDPVWFGVIMVILLEMGMLDGDDLPRHLAVFLRDARVHRDPRRVPADRPGAAEYDDPMSRRREP